MCVTRQSHEISDLHLKIVDSPQGSQEQDHARLEHECSRDDGVCGHHHLHFLFSQQIEDLISDCERERMRAGEKGS